MVDKLKKFNLIFIFIFVIFATFVLAVKIDTIQTSTGDNQLSIIYPETNNIYLGENIELNFHVVNSSGALLSNNQYNCTIHIYSNINDAHIFYSSNFNKNFSYDIGLKLNYSVLNDTGIYDYNLFCNSTKEFGYLSNNIIVEIPKTPISAIILFVLFIISGIIGYFLNINGVYAISIMCGWISALSYCHAWKNTIYYTDFFIYFEYLFSAAFFLLIIAILILSLNKN